MCSIRKSDGSIFEIPKHLIGLSDYLTSSVQTLNCFHLIEDYLSSKKWKCISDSKLLEDCFPDNISWITDKELFESIETSFQSKIGSWKMTLSNSQLTKFKHEINILDKIITNFSLIFQPEIHSFKYISIDAMLKIESFFQVCSKHYDDIKISKEMFNYLPQAYKEGEMKDSSLKSIFKNKHEMFYNYMNDNAKLEDITNLAQAAIRLEIKPLQTLTALFLAHHIRLKPFHESLSAFKVPFKYTNSINKKLEAMLK